MAKIALSLVAAPLAAALVAAPASAAEFIITYTGTVSSGSDQTGVFGTAGANLAGHDFTLVYTLTSPMPGAYTYDNGITAYTRGGSNVRAPSPLSAVFTLGGTSIDISGDYYGLAWQDDEVSGGLDQVYHHSEDKVATSADMTHNIAYSYFTSNINNIVSTQDYTHPLSYFVQSGDTSYGIMRVQTYNYGTGLNSIYAYATLNPRSVTIAPAGLGAVPEPSTWAMMLFGFGAVGFAMRRRRKQDVQVRFDYA